MGKLYEKIDEEEIMCKDILLPEYFPATYIDQYDEIYCYYGIIDKDRFLLHSYPYWLKGIKPSEAKKNIRGYFRIKKGLIIEDKTFMDEKHGHNSQAKCKKIECGLELLRSMNNPYGIYYSKDKEIEKELTRKVFGITYEELAKLLYHYNKVFEIVPETYYSRYPSITRSVKSDNYCDITNMWIPANFPYIAFQESGYYYSHISLYGFCEQVRFITQNYINSTNSKKLIDNGLDKEILESLFNIQLYDSDYIPIDYNRQIELEETCENRK